MLPLLELPRRVEYQLATDDNHRNAPLKRNARIKFRWANCYIIAYLIQPQYKLMMEEQTYLDTFEARVKSAILLPVEDLEEDFILTDDITAQWERIEQEYIADAVIQIRDYPEVSVAWASYIGMAIAEGWDKDWDTISKTPYTAFYGEQGFDDMDDHIITHYLGLSLDCDTTKKYVSLFQTCAKIATNCIRREQIPPQSPLAYHCFVRICKLMFAIGASIRLKHLGYSLQKIDL